MQALPAKYFAFGPYRVEQVNPSWWGVMNRNGFNCLTFPDKPGAVVTDEQDALRIANQWNETKEFVYPRDTYVPAVTTPMTDDKMAAYVRSRTYRDSK